MVLDMGRTLTQKAIVVEMALLEMNAQQFARRIYHTAEVVDHHYLHPFDTVGTMMPFSVCLREV